MEIKVSATSRPGAVAGAIAHTLREQKHAEVQAIGAAAVYQAVKAITIARSYLRDEGLDLIFIPMFVQVEIRSLERAAIRLMVELCAGAADTYRGTMAR